MILAEIRQERRWGFLMAHTLTLANNLEARYKYFVAHYSVDAANDFYRKYGTHLVAVSPTTPPLHVRTPAVTRGLTGLYKLSKIPGQPLNQSIVTHYARN